ncbi:unnamed protein product [Cyclocybe aegerita]|uniref:Amino acid transporter n=1 Tax=Cyclocybe aegerita TaxID=1973307 RepID=A0A8S0X742_CYCAE|nr:unnamed protein product [Cyclocybe aegerita]
MSAENHTPRNNGIKPPGVVLYIAIQFLKMPWLPTVSTGALCSDHGRRKQQLRIEVRSYDGPDLENTPPPTLEVLVNPAGYAFGDFTNVSGWSDGYAFILSFLSPLWAIAAFDSMVRISEEATHADIAIPFAIILSTSMKSVLISPIGQPMAAILFNAMGKKGTLVIWAFIIVIQFTLGTSMLTACSRQVFTFSGDGAPPFSRYLYRVNKWAFARVTCVWTLAFMALLLGLLSFASTAAIGAVFSLVVAGQYTAYSVPISRRFLGVQEIRKGPFTLGRMSKPVAATAVIFMLFIMVVFLFPASPHPDTGGLNYTVVVLVVDVSF